MVSMLQVVSMLLVAPTWEGLEEGEGRGRWQPYKKGMVREVDRQLLRRLAAVGRTEAVLEDGKMIREGEKERRGQHRWS